MVYPTVDRVYLRRGRRIAICSATPPSAPLIIIPFSYTSSGTGAQCPLAFYASLFSFAVSSIINYNIYTPSCDLYNTSHSPFENTHTRSNYTVVFQINALQSARCPLLLLRPRLLLRRG